MRTNRNPVSALETGFLTERETRFRNQKPGFRTRSAFTLLEVLLASLIAILLLSALYFAMDVTLRQTQESRDGVDVDNLSRGVFTRIGLDLSGSLGPMPPKSGGNASSSSGSGSSSSSPSSSSTPTDPSTAASAASTAAAAAGVDPSVAAAAGAAASTDATA